MPGIGKPISDFAQLFFPGDPYGPEVADFVQLPETSGPEVSDFAQLFFPGDPYGPEVAETAHFLIGLGFDDSGFFPF